ncbi:ABC transporter permease [Paenibacillus sp. NPDC057967]|uniref:ABC transporter permease n=1 Tax=Paenibacillus sp. NPDC057967 TaxID=3346293 RepID=UPI0036D908FC
MFPYLKKDLLIFWRDRSEMLVVLLVPVVLSVILGFALSSWIEGEPSERSVSIALVVEDNEESAIAAFRDTVQTLNRDEEWKASVLHASESYPLIEGLRMTFASDEIKEWIHTVETSTEQASELLEKKEVSAVLTIPSGFSLQTLKRAWLEEGDGGTVVVTAPDHSIKLDMVMGVVDRYVREANVGMGLRYVLQEAPGQQQVNEGDLSLPKGGVELLDSVKPLTSFQYFSVSIGMIFTVFIAATIALHASGEKRERVIERIRLSGNNPFHYLGGKLVASFMIACMQLTSVLTICHFVLGLFHGRSAGFWIGIALIIMMFSFMVASMASVFTSVMFRMSNVDAANALFNLLLIMIGVIGGGFVPLYVLPEWLRSIGEWTPNGHALTMALSWIQYEDAGRLSSQLLFLFIYAIVLVAVSALVYPRRGRAI